MLIQFYQDHLSAADGHRCPMSPSCSEYAARAIKKHGLFVGWIMACDRLVRCGRDEVTISPLRFVNGKSYTFDPVDANDFWWFDQSNNKTNNNADNKANNKTNNNANNKAKKQSEKDIPPLK
ncbi:MAG: membrane protein insertion efficiency factor YidD [Desulfobacteraceae bacterium]|nr:membrane protein insertion efficiency factor YidD [Desulfobacteraceae bacterium]